VRGTAFDQVLPATVVGELRTRIIQAQARRARPGDSGTHWYPLGLAPGLVFEQVIQHLRHFVPRGDDYVGAEWWFRATPTDTGFPFHFDRDEGIRSRVVSPDLLSILYLSDAGGPTVIVDATPARTSAPTRAIAVQPRTGRFAMFPGDRLHGVLPAPPGRWPRITMLINWWRTVPRMEPAPPEPGRRTAVDRRGVTTRRRRAPVAPLDTIDPSRLLAKAAWRELIFKQATYR